MVDRYQNIGAEIVDCVGGDFSKALAYVEAQDGAVSVGIFHTAANARAISYISPSSEILDEAYALWEEMAAGSKQPWFVMLYVIEDGQFAVDLKYPDQLDLSQGTIDRRDGLVREKFANLPIEY